MNQPPTPRQATPAALLSSRRASSQLPVEIMSSTSAKFEKYVDPATGWPYYYNTTTGESTYDRPQNFRTEANPFASARTMEPASMLTTRRAASQAPAETLSGDWAKYVDPESGYPYYYNSKTDVSQYERPVGFATVRMAPSAMTEAQRARADALKLYNAGCELRDEGDYKEAAGVFKKLAKQNHPLACHNLGILYEQGLGVQRDMVEAMKCYSTAAEKNIPESQYSLACLLRDVMGDFDEATALFEMAAAQGHAGANFNLGVYHASARDDPSVKEAVQCYRAAAEKGHVKAAVNLGVILTGSKSDEVDDAGFARPAYDPTPEERAEGGKWLQVAADSGDHTAQFNMAVKCKEENDVENMVVFLEKASEGGHVRGSYNYAKSLIRGDGKGEATRADLDRAAELLNFCADEGDEKANKDARKLMKATRAEDREKKKLEEEEAARLEVEAAERERLRFEQMRIAQAQKAMEEGLREKEKELMSDETTVKQYEDENEQPIWGRDTAKNDGKPTNEAVARVKAAAAKKRAEKAEKLRKEKEEADLAKLLAES
jgi:TPR repeat protein